MRTRWLSPAAGRSVVLMALAAMVAAGCGSSSTTRSSTAPPTSPATPTSTAPPASPATPTSTASPTAPATPTSPATPTTPNGPRLPGRLTVTPLVGRPAGTERFAITLPASAVTPRSTSGSSSASGPAVQTSMQLAVTRVTPTGPAAGCLADRLVPLAGIPLRQTLTVALGPAQGDPDWCRGVFSARVQELARPVCRPGEMCPQFVRLVGVLGPVRFRIR